MIATSSPRACALRLRFLASAFGVVPLLLVSCSTNRAPVLSTMSASVETDRKLAQATPFHRTLSLSAAAPFTDVANVWRYDPKAGYSTAIGVTRTPSFISRTEVVNEEGYAPQHLQDLQGALLELQQLAAERVTYRFQKELLPRARRYETLEVDRPDSPSLASPPGQIYLETLGEGTRETTVYESNLEAKLIGENYSKTLEDYKTAYIRVAELVNQPGIVVMRWQSESDSEGSLKIPGLASLGGSKARKFGGLIVAAGVRQSILHVGPDIFELRQWIPSHQVDRMKVTTHILQTQHAIWVKDLTMESVFGAQFRISLQNGALRHALNAAQIELALAQASITNLASLGYFSQPRRTVEPVDWSVDGNIRRLEAPDWFTLLMVDSTVRNLQQIASRGGGHIPR